MPRHEIVTEGRSRLGQRGGDRNAASPPRVGTPRCRPSDRKFRRRARRRAAGAARTVHQPRLLVLSRRRQAARRIWPTDPSLVALSVPIDYWDYLGWKDTLASPAHSARQRAYARVRGDRQVYTPQIVVNGAMHVLGSDRAAIERAIAQTDQKSGGDVAAGAAVGRRRRFEREGRSGGERARRRRSLAVPADEGGAGRHRPRRESRAHDHLPQRGAALAQARRLDRHGRRPGAFRSPRSRPTTSMPPRSWCRKARTTSRASSSAPPSPACNNRTPDNARIATDRSQQKGRRCAGLQNCGNEPYSDGRQLTASRLGD